MAFGEVTAQRVIGCINGLMREQMDEWMTDGQMERWTSRRIDRATDGGTTCTRYSVRYDNGESHLYDCGLTMPICDVHV